VNMTERNIAGKDPFGVYKQETPVMMFLSIAFNNIKVAFFCYVGGIFLGIGSRKSTGSRLISAVKPVMALSVLWWAVMALSVLCGGPHGNTGLL
jgi:hypothetical protein